MVRKGLWFLRSLHARNTGKKGTGRVDTEDFAWLLFEYGAHPPVIEVIAYMMSFLKTTQKGGVTSVALSTSVTLFALHRTLFKVTVSNASECFVHVRERALRVRRAQGIVRMPLNACMGADQGESAGGSHSVRNTALCSILEGIQAPPHVSSVDVSVEAGKPYSADPFQLDKSLSAFMTHRGLETRGKQGKSSVRGSNREHVPFTSSNTRVAQGPVEKRVLFDLPWSKDPAAP
ncbi:hypothetical protein KUCAC02_008234 [Chaenocephalus aceratus]|uniref:Uncharacterized protein n=1 Tax=Chaenocephalus aceratus TaxID=36190 RepID=A0ACB9X9M5_CHAAC|nr:hypothetical protein KUCAC02_008234 [Chaenocephalus aceratus]